MKKNEKLENFKNNEIKDDKNKEFSSINPAKIYEMYFQSYGDIEAIKKLISKLKLSPSGFCEILLEYIKNHYNRSQYAIFFDKLDLIDITEKRKIATYCYNSSLSLNEIQNNFQSYVFMYRPDILLNNIALNILKKKIEIYEEYLRELNKKTIYTTSLSYCKQLFQVFMESNYSILRFCYHNRILVSYFKNCLAKVKKEEPMLYSEIEANIILKEQIKERIIENDVYEILNKIKELGDDFSIIDFLTITNYSFDEIIKKADYILSVEDTKLLRHFISRYKRIKPYNENEIQKLLEDKTIYNIDNQIIEIPLNVKEEIINYLNKKNISISDLSFHDACVRYYRNTLFVDFSK